MHNWEQKVLAHFDFFPQPELSEKEGKWADLVQCLEGEYNKVCVAKLFW